VIQFMQSMPFEPVFSNDNTALNPTLWAKYSLAVLESTMIAANLVYRDFENEIAKFGQTINTRKPSGFTAKRKTDADQVTVQDATLTNIPVTLDQHPHVSFLINDGEESMAIESLLEIHLMPAMIAMAEMIDSSVLGQYARFLRLGQVAGGLGGLTNANYKDYLASLCQVFDTNKAPVTGRVLIVTPSIKRLILSNAAFTAALNTGDGGYALRTANLGELFGFQHYMCQNMASVASSVDIDTTFLVNLGAGYAAGTTTFAVDGGTGTLTVGTWFTLGGFPYQVTAQSANLGNTISITIASPGLQAAVLNNAPLTIFVPSAVNFTAGYATGYAKYITFGSNTLAPKRGQLVSFGTDVTNVYTVIEVSGQTILLDRPLVAAIADTNKVNWGPTGEFAFAFLRNAIALVCRPLALPLPGTGALSGSAVHNGFALRVVITYLGLNQGHLVTIDCLFGLAVMESKFGGVLLG
jgi:hypothetical protein